VLCSSHSCNCLLSLYPIDTIPVDLIEISSLRMGTAISVSETSLVFNLFSFFFNFVCTHLKNFTIVDITGG
jgi:hypothetical protein